MVWTTKNREPVIGRSQTGVLEQSLVATCNELGVKVHAIGIMPDHVHIAISAPPRLALAEVVKRLKGSSSHLLNRTNGNRTWPGWQAEYGVISFGERSLDRIVLYVRSQEAHHTSEGVWPTFETIEENDYTGMTGIASPGGTLLPEPGNSLPGN